MQLTSQMVNKSSSSSQDVKLILSRLMSLYHLRNEAKLADFLGVNQSVLSTWKRRGHVGVRLILRKCEGISLDWLLKGEGDPLSGSAKLPEGSVADGDLFYGTPDAIVRAKTAEQMEAIFRQMDEVALQKLLILCGLPENVSREMIVGRPKDYIARHATDLMWLRLGYRVERIPT